MTDDQPHSPRALACPYCGSSLWINTETVGRPYLTYEKPESIECNATDCGAVWDPDGSVRDEPRWIRYPDAYTTPERSHQASPGLQP